MTQTLLKIGLIVDSTTVSKYTYDLAVWGQAQPRLRISHLVIQSRKPAPKEGLVQKVRRTLGREGGVRNLLEQTLFSWIVKKEEAFLKKAGIRPDHLLDFDLGALNLPSVCIEPQVSGSGFVYRYAQADVARVRALGLDVLIRCGTGILRGEILQSARLGVLSFHHADNRINRGGPAGFWEVFFQQDSTGFIIQRLTEELDGGVVLGRGWFPTQPRYLLNQSLLFQKSNYHLMKMLLDVAQKGELPAGEEPTPYYKPLFRKPGMAQQIAYVAKTSRARLHDIYRSRILRRDRRWGVAFSRGGWKDIVMWRATRIENPPNHFLADPFVIDVGGRDYCLLEDYDYARGKGCIAAYELTDRGAIRLGDVLVEPFHLSFPYLFRFDGRIFMCPETFESKEIRVYECESFPLKWKLSRILMRDVSAVDTMIFEKDGLWWLLTNIDPSRSGDHGSELYVFHADSPLSTEWTPHPRNPVCVDASKARNGGLLAHDGLLYRVGQKQGYQVYGKGFSIQRIARLDPDAYEESLLCAVAPDFFPGLDGTHHMHSNGRVTVFDYVQWTSISR